MIKKELEKLEIWKYLTEDEKIKVVDNSQIRLFNKNESILDMTSSCLGLMYIISGSIRISIISNEGREATLFKLIDEDTCVLSSLCVIKQIKLDTMIEALEDTKVLVVSSSVIDYLIENNLKVKCFLYELTIERFNQALLVLQEVLFEKIDKRLAKYLYDIAMENNANTIYTTQEEIAKDISSSREVVTRMLKNFVNEGILEIKRGSIHILKLDKLDEIARK